MLTRKPRALIVAAVFLLGTLVTQLITAPNVLAQTAVSSRDAQTVVDMLNANRRALGLSTLTVNDQLTTEGRAWTLAMHDARTLRHSPNLERITTAGFAKAGENVGYSDDSLAALYARFDASPEHRRNLQDPQWNCVGVGVVFDSGEYWVTMLFGNRAPVRTMAMAKHPRVSVSLIPFAH